MKGINKGATDTEITTTIFASATKNSELFKAISDREDILKTKLSWSAKVIEKGGAPIMSLLMKKFPMKEGCPEGTQCVVSENEAINCTRKGVVYQAT